MTTSQQLPPQTLPLTVEGYRLLVDQGIFAGQAGQIELIHGRIVSMNPQGPIHSDPIDELEHWSHQVAADHFRIRVEKPLEVPLLNSCPEPDIAWVRRRRYADRHPGPNDVHLLIEVSGSSKSFDRGEKLRVYAAAGIIEYWIVDVTAQSIEIFTHPQSTTYGISHRYGLGDHVCPACMPSAELSVARLFSDSIE